MMTHYEAVDTRQQLDQATEGVLKLQKDIIHLEDSICNTCNAAFSQISKLWKYLSYSFLATTLIGISQLLIIFLR